MRRGKVSLLAAVVLVLSSCRHRAIRVIARRAAVLCAAALMLALIGPAEARVAGGSGALKLSTGRIGRVTIDRSTRRAVIRFAGRPQAEERRRYFGSPPSDTLGYRCTPANRPWAFRVGTQNCRTAYFININTGKLATFYTGSQRFRERHGVRVGTPARRAVRRLHAPATAGCLNAIRVRARRTLVTFAIGGGQNYVKDGQSRVRGGRVALIVVHSRRHDIAGAFDCV